MKTRAKPAPAAIPLTPPTDIGYHERDAERKLKEAGFDSALIAAIKCEDPVVSFGAHHKVVTEALQRNPIGIWRSVHDAASYLLFLASFKTAFAENDIRKATQYAYFAGMYAGRMDTGVEVQSAKDELESEKVLEQINRSYGAELTARIKRDKRDSLDPIIRKVWEAIPPKQRKLSTLRFELAEKHTVRKSNTW